MPNKPDPQVILDKIDMLIDKLKPTVNITSSSENVSSLGLASANISNSLSNGKNSSKLVLAQVDSGNIDSMMHSIVENVLENFRKAGAATGGTLSYIVESLLYLSTIGGI